MSKKNYDKHGNAIKRSPNIFEMVAALIGVLLGCFAGAALAIWLLGELFQFVVWLDRSHPEVVEYAEWAWIIPAGYYIVWSFRTVFVRSKYTG